MLDASTMGPVILFVYNRPHHTERTIEALQRNIGAADTELLIFSDGPKDDDCNSRASVNTVREYLKGVKGFKKVHIIERPVNLGLAVSVIRGVSEVVSQYGRVIVLEDDLVTHPQFLLYMNLALNKYEAVKKVFSVTGYNYPLNMMSFPKNYNYSTFFSYRCHSWGWGTWKDRWEEVDFEMTDFDKFVRNTEDQRRFNRGGDDLTQMLKDQMSGKLDSWAIRFCYSHFKFDAYCLYPVQSLISNIGLDGSGVHCGTGYSYDASIGDDVFEFVFPDEVVIDPYIAEQFRSIFAMRRKRGGLRGMMDWLFDRFGCRVKSLRLL